MSTDDALVVPQPGREKETIRLLLELADSRHHVKTNTDGPGLTLVVPDYLHQRYLQATTEQPPTPKRRGRPPGRTTSTTPQVEASEKDSED